MKILACLLVLALAFCMTVSLGMRRQVAPQHKNTFHAGRNQHDQLYDIGRQLFDLFASPEDKAAGFMPTVLKYGARLLDMNSSSWDVTKITSRSIQVVFENLSNQRIQHVNDYFFSGDWTDKKWNDPIEPLSLEQGIVASTHFYQGVTGSAKLKIADQNVYIYLGFLDPLVTSYKFYGEVTADNHPADYGYDNSFGTDPIKSTFGKFTLEVKQTESKIAQTAYIYRLTEQGVDKESVLAKLEPAQA